MKKLFVVILLAVVFAFAAVKNNCVIELNSGESLKGELVEENDDFVIIESETLGKMTIQRSKIKDISKIDSSTGYMYNDPNHNTLFIMPSAETNPKGSNYLSNYELLYMNVGHSFTDDLHVSLGFLFPITSEFISHGPLTLGLKQRLLCEPEKYNVSLMGSCTFALVEDYSLLTFGGAINYYTSPDFTFNFYLGDMFDPKANEINHLINFGVGITARTGESTKLIVEYLNGQIEDEIFDGIFLIGVRFFGKKLSVDLAGLAPLTGGEWFLLPFLNFTYHF